MFQRNTLQAFAQNVPLERKHDDFFYSTDIKSRWDMKTAFKSTTLNY
jgi:hypothetical protein